MGVAKQKLIIARRSRANRLALVEALNAGITTVHNFAHNTRTPAHVDAELRAMAESGLRVRYSYGYIAAGELAASTARSAAASDARRTGKRWVLGTGFREWSGHPRSSKACARGQGRVNPSPHPHRAF